MKFIIDDANVEAIKNLYEYFPVEGVTTNPSILAKSKRPPYEVLKEIRQRQSIHPCRHFLRQRLGQPMRLLM